MVGVVRTAGYQMADATRRCFLAVVVEKPFVNSSAEADECIACAKKQGKILTVFQSQYPIPPWKGPSFSCFPCHEKPREKGC